MGLSLEQSELPVRRRYGEADWGKEITIGDELRDMRDGKGRGSFYHMEVRNII